MPQTRHRTVIEIGVDDRQIKGLDQTLHRAFDDQLVANFDRMLERTGKTLEQMTKAAERFDQLMRQSGGAGGGGGGGRQPPRGGGSGGGGGGPGGGDLRALTRAIEGLQRAQSSAGGNTGPSFMSRVGSTAFGTYLGGLASNATGDGFISRAVGGVPVVGGFLGGAINQIQRYYGQFAAAEQVRSRAAGGLGRGRLRWEDFARFGLSAPEAMQSGLGYAQGAGLSGEGASDAFMRRALSLQMLGGVQGAEGVVRGSGVGRSGPAHMDFTQGAPEQLMMQAVSTGIQSGIRESRLSDFAQAATQVLESGRLGGTDLNLAGVLQTMRGLAGLGAGFSGEQGSRAMQGAVQAMGTFEPGSDASSLVALRAVGFGTNRSYHEAVRFIQDRPGEALPLILEQIRGMAPGNEGAQQELMRMLLPQFGINPTRQQMESLARGDLSGFGMQPGTGAAEDFMQRRGRSVGGAFGTPGLEAGVRNRQLRIGGNVRGAAVGVRDAEMRMTESVLPPVAEGIDSVLTWMNGAVDAFQQSGGAGLMGYLMEGMRDGTGGLLGMLTGGGSGEPSEGRRRLEQILQGDLPVGPTRRQMGTPLPPAIQEQVDRHEQTTFERGVQQWLHEYTGAPAPAPTPGAGGPEASLGDALRRARDALSEAAAHADRAGLAGEGDLALG